MMEFATQGIFRRYDLMDLFQKFRDRGRLKDLSSSEKFFVFLMRFVVRDPQGLITIDPRSALWKPSTRALWADAQVWRPGNRPGRRFLHARYLLSISPRYDIIEDGEPRRRNSGAPERPKDGSEAPGDADRRGDGQKAPPTSATPQSAIFFTSSLLSGLRSPRSSETCGGAPLARSLGKKSPGRAIRKRRPRFAGQRLKDCAGRQAAVDRAPPMIYNYGRNC